jgi:late competence protein required for DNA uptake (superfamily II DNA/RNA helicase)
MWYPFLTLKCLGKIKLNLNGWLKEKEKEKNKLLIFPPSLGIYLQ